MTALGILEILIELACVALLLRIAVRDFKTLTVSNADNLALLGLYLLWAAIGGFQDFWTDLLIGGLLFGVALIMWLLRTLGAGDVKLYFTLGMLIGIKASALFVVILLVLSFFFAAILRWARFPDADQTTHPTKWRLREIQITGRLPYAVVMVLAAALPLALRFAGAA